MSSEPDLQELLDRGWSEAQSAITDGLTAAAVAFAIAAAISAGYRMLRATSRLRENPSASRAHAREQLLLRQGD